MIIKIFKFFHGYQGSGIVRDENQGLLGMGTRDQY